MIEPILFVYLLVMAFVIAKLRNLFAAAMLTGIFSLLSAGLFDLMDAVDVAFTEAAVGAGISTVLMLATLGLTTDTERPARGNETLPLMIVIAMGALLVYATLDMHPYGDPSAIIHHHVAPRYLQDSGREIGIPNVVTSVLTSYRGYDTFGELTVVLTAGTGVLLLLSRPDRTQTRSEPSNERLSKIPSLRTQPVLRAVTKLLFPFILLFALYTQAHGDYGPGGGFQAGVIFAAAFILYTLIYGAESVQNVARPAWVRVAAALGVLVYGGVGLLCLAKGGNFLDYNALSPEHPQHGQHVGIFLVELGVGITVASVMLLIYYAFTAAEPS